MDRNSLNSKKLLWIGLALALALIGVLYSSFLNYRAALVERLTIAADLRLNAVQVALAEVEADVQIFASAFGELHGEKEYLQKRRPLPNFFCNNISTTFKLVFLIPLAKKYGSGVGTAPRWQPPMRFKIRRTVTITGKV